MSSPAYSPTYQTARENVMKRDGYECIHCGWTRESDESRQLHAHHVIPRRLFDDPQIADQESNLVTLCSMCHGGWEKATRRMLKG